MNGYDLGRAVSGQILGLLLVVFAAGGLIALGGYFLVSWLVTHVSVSTS